jgi:hypothetical protein
MFPAKLIGLAFIVMLFLPWAIEKFQNKVNVQQLKLLSAFAFLVSVYCFFAGLMLYTGWTNPLAGADPHLLGTTAAKGRGGGGLILLMIAYWPHALMVVALITGFIWGLTFRNAIHKAKLAAAAIR